MLDTRNQLPKIRDHLNMFFAADKAKDYLLVTDKDSLTSFISAHITARFLGNPDRYTHLDVRACEELKSYLKQNRNLRLAIFDCLFTMDELIDIVKYCKNMVVFTTKYTLKSVYHDRQLGKLVPATMSIFDPLNGSIPLLMYRAFFGDGEVPDFVTSTDMGLISPTILTPEIQLMVDLDRDHQIWLNRYPNQADIAADAETNGYRFYDNANKCRRLLRDNTTSYFGTNRRAVYVNCNKEDMPGMHSVIKSMSDEGKLYRCDYHALYEIKDNWIYYELVRHSNRIDFKEEFSKLAIHGSTYSVIIRKPNANIFKTIQL